MRKHNPGQPYDPRAPRPHLQKLTDPFDRARRIPFLMQRCQAKFRDETWYLTFEEWCSFWTVETWEKRGRHPSDLCMTRIDHNEAWAIGNVALITRTQQLQESNKRRSRKNINKENQL